jgi:hypothetical protein
MVEARGINPAFLQRIGEGSSGFLQLLRVHDRLGGARPTLPPLARPAPPRNDLMAASGSGSAELLKCFAAQDQFGGLMEAPPDLQPRCPNKDRTEAGAWRWSREAKRGYRDHLRRYAVADWTTRQKESSRLRL